MKTTPFWWEEAAPTHGNRVFNRTDYSVLIVGSGYGGLSAAITLAENGVKNIVVVDAMRIGEGASSRNGGQIVNEPKFSFAQASRRFGEKRAREIMDDYAQSINFMISRANSLGENIDLNLSGAISAAHSRKDLEKMRAMRDALSPDKKKNFEIIAEQDIHTVLKTDIYRGAMIHHEQGTIHPGKYVRALANRARSLGVEIVTGKRFDGSSIEGNGHTARLTDVELRSSDEIRADKILIAVNGYVDSVFPWLQKRTIPVQSYMIATEEMPFDLLEQLIPHNRAVMDTKNVLYYFRRSPDGKRILFGGRARFSNATEVEGAEGLRRFMEHTFPETRGVSLTHAWHGNVCFAYDFCSHGGQMDNGVYYISCCNGAGISNQTWMGHRIAEYMLELPNTDRGVIGNHFPRLYLYNGNPWFLPVVGSWYRLLDKAARWKEKP